MKKLSNTEAEAELKKALLIKKHVIPTQIQHRPRSRHAHEYSEYKTCLSITMFKDIKQQLSST